MATPTQLEQAVSGWAPNSEAQGQREARRTASWTKRVQESSGFQAVQKDNIFIFPSNCHFSPLKSTLVLELGGLALIPGSAASCITYALYTSVFKSVKWGPYTLPCLHWEIRRTNWKIAHHAADPKPSISRGQAVSMKR